MCDADADRNVTSAKIYSPAPTARREAVLPVPLANRLRANDLKP